MRSEKLAPRKGFETQTPIEHHRVKENKNLFWNTNVVSTALGSFPKRPYVCYKDKESAIIIDAALVADHNVNKTFLNKINKYQELMDFYRNVIPTKERIIVPVVMSINGLVHKESINLMKNKLKINIDWNTTVRNIVARNMIDLMYFNGVNITETQEEENQQENDEKITTALVELFKD